MVITISYITIKIIILRAGHSRIQENNEILPK